MQVTDEICFKYNKIHKFDNLERQSETMGVNIYAGTFLMASFN